MQKVSDPLLLNQYSFSPRLVAAPMAGYSNTATRLLYRRMGAGMCVTEMVSAKALVMGSRETFLRLATAQDEDSVCLQLFGGCPEEMGEAARIVCGESRVQCLDINMGCPVKKIAKNGYGAQMMGDPLRVYAVVHSMVSKSSLPVTVKMRSGPNQDQINFLEIGKACQDAGAAAITLHPRNKHQKFSGLPAWEYISQLKQALKIPVIGNGDVSDALDALRMFEKTGCDAVMIGRGAVGNPWIFQQILQMECGLSPIKPSISDQAAMALTHLDLEVEYSKRPPNEYLRLRKSLPEYFRNSQHYESIKLKIQSAENNSELRDVLLGWDCW